MVSNDEKLLAKKRIESAFHSAKKEKEKERARAREIREREIIFLCTLGDQWSSWIADGELSKLNKNS